MYTITIIVYDKKEVFINVIMFLHCKHSLLTIFFNVVEFVHLKLQITQVTILLDQKLLVQQPVRATSSPVIERVSVLVGKHRSLWRQTHVLKRGDPVGCLAHERRNPVRLLRVKRRHQVCCHRRQSWTSY